MKSENPDAIYVLKGNHELFLQMYVENRLRESTWKAFGGDYSVEEYNNLRSSTKNAIYEFIRNMPHYLYVNTEKNGELVITHSGLLENTVLYTSDGKIDVKESIQKAVDYDEYKLLISSDIHYMSTVNLSNTMIVGHVPTIFLENESYDVLRKRNLICIDSGAGYRSKGGRLALYRVEDDSVYYS